MGKKLSILIPVYNGEKYLRECIDSILNQTYKNIEIVIIDDGSTDSSLSIIQEYTENNSNIIFSSQKNSGQSAARKKALELSSGEYIGYVDCDDIVEKTLYEEIMTILEADRTLDLLSFNYKRYGKSKNIYSDKSIKSGKYTKVDIEDKIVSKMLGNRNLSGFRGIPIAIYTKIYKRGLAVEINKTLPLFIEMGEDVIHTSMAILMSKNIYIAASNINGYNYRLVNGSISWSYKKELLEKSLVLGNYLTTLSSNKDYNIDIEYEFCFIALLTFFNEYLFGVNRDLS